MAKAFRTTILGKYEADYFRCSACGFMQTDDPHWLAESYSSAINEIDLGSVNRAIIASKLIEGIILSSFDKNAKYIDYGAGYGVLVRLMRDNGFNFFWQDPFCENLFAKHFVADKNTTYELLSAFEVFEHLVNPLEQLEGMLSYSRNILFSTLLVPASAKVAADWWYFGPEHGQHVAFYTLPALQKIAERFKLHLNTDGSGTHLLSEKPVSQRVFRFFARETRWSRLTRAAMRRGMRKQSLLADDFHKVSGHAI